MTTWSDRRRQFSHDWLRWKFLPAMAGLVNELNGEFEVVRIDATFLSQWPSRSIQLFGLLDNLDSEMNPARNLEQPEFVTLCEDRIWLRQLVSQLWKIRRNIDGTMQELRTELKQANLLHTEVSRQLCDESDFRSLDHLLAVRKQLIGFHKHVRRIATALAKLPH